MQILIECQHCHHNNNATVRYKPAQENYPSNLVVEPTVCIVCANDLDIASVKQNLIRILQL